MAQISTADNPPAISRRTGYALAALGAILFSTKGILIKLAYGQGGAPEVDAITLLTLRMAFSLPFYVLAGVVGWHLRRNGGQTTPNARQLVLTAGLGMMCYYLSAYLDFEGLVYLSAQFERLLLFTYPIFVMLLGAMFFGGRLTFRGVLTVFISYSGIAVIFAGGATAKGDHILFGAGLVLGAAIIFAFYQLAAKPLLVAVGNRIFTSMAMGAASVATLVHFLMFNHFDTLFAVSPHVLWLAFLMAVFSTVLPSFMVNAALARTGAQAVSMISTVSPVATIVLAVLVIDESFTLVDALGTLLVIGGVGLFTWYDSRASHSA